MRNQAFSKKEKEKKLQLDAKKMNKNNKRKGALRKMKKIQAINDHVVVEELIKTEDKTEAGIIIPQTVKMEPQKYGKVLSIGEKVTNLKVDDIVVFHQSGGQAVIVNGVIQRILKNDEIYGVLS